MSRIRKAFEIRFRTLLQKAGARRLEPGVAFLMQRAREQALSDQAPEAEVLLRNYERLRAKPRFRSTLNSREAVRFFCDSGLGGLARWLRAAGYRSAWKAHICDDDLVREVQQTGAILITTDSLLMERRVLRDNVVTGLWLPPILSIQQQVELVFREFKLRPREPLCMVCGGDLLPAPKRELASRIPPRTYNWLDNFFLCGQCGKIYWHGTHWFRIRAEIERLERAVGA